MGGGVLDLSCCTLDDCRLRGTSDRGRGNSENLGGGDPGTVVVSSESGNASDLRSDSLIRLLEGEGSRSDAI